jgi:hypothetical protein
MSKQTPSFQRTPLVATHYGAINKSGFGRKKAAPGHAYTANISLLHLRQHVCRRSESGNHRSRRSTAITDRGHPSSCHFHHSSLPPVAFAEVTSACDTCTSIHRPDSVEAWRSQSAAHGEFSLRSHSPEGLFRQAPCLEGPLASGRNQKDGRHHKMVRIILDRFIENGFIISIVRP